MPQLMGQNIAMGNEDFSRSFDINNSLSPNSGANYRGRGQNNQRGYGRNKFIGKRSRGGGNHHHKEENNGTNVVDVEQKSPSNQLHSIQEQQNEYNNFSKFKDNRPAEHNRRPQRQPARKPKFLGGQQNPYKSQLKENQQQQNLHSRDFIPIDDPSIRNDSQITFPNPTSNNNPVANNKPQQTQETSTVNPPATDLTPLIKPENIKKEKAELAMKQKTIITNKESSSDSDTSSSEEENTAQTTAVNKKSKTLQSITKPTISSSSSDFEAEVANETPTSASVPATNTKQLESESKSKHKAKKSNKDEVVCIGQLEQKFSIQDDDEDNETIDDGGAKCEAATLKKNVEQCMICDEKNHTSFQCQMICKNCDAPYHNLKTCPQSPNVSVMLQSFMEFCMLQLHNFNAGQYFTLPDTLLLSNNIANDLRQTSGSIISSSAASSRKRRGKGSLNSKKATKKRRKDTTSDSDDDNDHNMNERNAKESSNTSDSSSDSDSSEKTEVLKLKSKKKKRDAKIPTNKKSFTLHNHMAMQPNFQPPTKMGDYITPNTNFNPLFFSQMLQNAFPGRLNFNN